jgi:ubiquinol-cytochrome c reductase iron-sulfur subunit
MDRIARMSERGRTRNEERGGEAVVAVAFCISVSAAVGLAVLYWRGGQPQLEGALLAAAAGGIAVGLITWSHRLLPNAEEVEPRETMKSAERERDAFDVDLDRDDVLTRRRLLRRLLVGALAAIGAAFVLPLRSLGPRPDAAALDSSPWRPGTRLVTEDGSAVHVADVPAGGLVTVFPEGAVGSETGQAVLLRVEPGLVRPLPGRESWTPEGLIAYSKVCTHAGCPVGLYEAASHQLLCPCHQSTFDVLDGAKPVFGPAAARLPQLPLSIDAGGHVVAAGGFSEPPGPSYWNRSV